MEKPKLNHSQYLQIMDRLNVTCSNIDTHLLQHPVCKIRKNITAKVENALDNLFEAQLELQKMLNENL